MFVNFDKEKAYLLGLIAGRGHIFLDSKRIVIEFSHANEFAKGIAYCPKCGYLATKGNYGLKCKNLECGRIVDPSVKKIYNQPKKTVASLVDVIIPFLRSDISAKYEILGNKSMTLLVIDFSECAEIFNEIATIFNPDLSFDRFHIPEIIYHTTKENKIEFVNGLLDTSGFPSPGGWLNRDGKNGHGRMRVYFQIVRNWHLPVEIDNFLRSEFGLPVHTIDWGHPNIRDSNLKDYFNTRPTSWSREHQVKFFPEYYGEFFFRISSKQALFEELRDHNINVGFDNKEDWFPPSRINKKRIKAYHPGEADFRLPEPVRKHFDAFWQINLAMDCKFLTKFQNDSVNPTYFTLTGDSETSDDIKKTEKEFDIIRKQKKKEILATIDTEKNKTKKKASTKRTTKEQAMYAPLAEFLGGYLLDSYKESNQVFDTSVSNLNLFLNNGDKGLLKAFEYCKKFRIRPDIVGFLMESGMLVFIEAKITALDLKALGQLMGYCLVAQPEEAILTSTIKPSIALIKILKARPDLLEYGNGKKIKISVFNNGRMEFITI